MLVEYFNNTIEQSFLKALLSAVQLPQFKIVKDNDLIYRGYVYIYNQKVIRCTSTGYIAPTDNEVGTVLLGSSVEQTPAEYEVILDHYRFCQMSQEVETKEFIRASYYSTELHKQFGEYLRVIRDLYDIDLMGMYNCFSYEIFNDIHIAWTGDRYSVVSGPDTAKKVLAVPIRFNTTYTVALRSDQTVLIAPVLKLPTGKKALYVYESENSKVEYSPLIVPGCKFGNPFTFRVNINEYDGDVFKDEKYLYAIIQVNSKNDSSLVVLEGEYAVSKEYSGTMETEGDPVAWSYRINTYAPGVESPKLFSNYYTYIDDEHVVHDLPVIKHSFTYRPELLRFNDGTSYAYSNTVIQYLLRNVITNREVVEGNISYVKDLLNWDDLVDYWDDKIKYEAFLQYITGTAFSSKKPSDKKLRRECGDVTGFIDKQIEQYLVDTKIQEEEKVNNG